MNHIKALLIHVLLLALSIHACSSNPVVVSTPITPNSSNLVQPKLTMVISPTSTGPPGTSDSNPAPFGSNINVDNMRFVITGTVRPADGIVSSGNMFNNQPGEWQQYIFVTLEVTCETPTDQQCHLSIFKLKLIRSDSITKYPERIILGVDDILEDTDFNSGATISGNVLFIISIGDANLQLVYESLAGDSFYFALP